MVVNLACIWSERRMLDRETDSTDVLERLQ